MSATQAADPPSLLRNAIVMRRRFSISILIWLSLALTTCVAAEARADDEQTHWAFRTPTRPPIPSAKDVSWVRTPVDAFVLARLEAVGLRPKPRADAVRRLRRASLDLLGLPPTRQQVEVFLKDSSPDAWRRVIDRLLASPHYGERWGRHWLDLARYADSNGFEFDFERPYAWHYRDYVINSFNSDQPYDRFLIEQLAGDESDPNRFEALVATGFCRTGPTVGNQTLEKNRYDELDDVISTTTEVFLGLTLGCARCHDHKYDPLTQRDYYAMLAIFHTMAKRDHFVGSAQQRQELSRIDGQLRSARSDMKKLSNGPSRGRWRLQNGELVQDAIVPNARLFFGDPQWTDYTVEVEFLKTGGTQEAFNYEAGVCLAFRAADLKNFYWAHLGVSDNREHALEIEHNGGRAPMFPKVAGSVQRNQWYRLKAELRGESLRVWLDGKLLFDRRDKRHARGGIGFGNWLTTTRWKNLTVRDPNGAVLLDGFGDPAQGLQPDAQPDAPTRDVLNARIAALENQKARMPIAMSIFDSGREARVTKLFVRGDYRNPGSVVEPAVPVALATQPLTFPAPSKSATTTGRRRILAEWLVSPRNPLTARVMVNRIWQYHFGRGLVESSSNFGLYGDDPSHPRLLDWLAVEFIESGWSVKHMHRLIMTSSVYQQSSQQTPPAQASGRSADSEQERAVSGAGAGDADGRLLSRFRLRRLEAEVLRDRILASSGALNVRMHGPGIRPRMHPSVIATSTTRKWPTIDREGPRHWRRSVYIFTRRSILLPMLEVFDAPPTTESCERRQTTTVPTQALQLMNDVFTQDQALAMAAAVTRDVGTNAAQQVAAVYWRALARPPSAEEQVDCVRYLGEQRAYHAARGKQSNSHALADLCHVMFNLNEFAYLD